MNSFETDKILKPNFKKIATFQFTTEAMIIKGKLESEGIEVFIRDNNIVDANPFYSNAVGGVKLFVRDEDFDRTEEILSEMQQQENDNLLFIVKDDETDTKPNTIFRIIEFIRSLFSV